VLCRDRGARHPRYPLSFCPAYDRYPRRWRGWNASPARVIAVVSCFVVESAEASVIIALGKSHLPHGRYHISRAAGRHRHSDVISAREKPYRQDLRGGGLGAACRPPKISSFRRSRATSSPCCGEKQRFLEVCNPANLPLGGRPRKSCHKEILTFIVTPPARPALYQDRHGCPESC
jgi:hypothetical protein